MGPLRTIVSGAALIAALIVGTDPLRAAEAAGEQAVIKQYCMGCHNQKAKLGGLVLDPAYLDNAGTHAAVLEKVLRKVQAGVMPPAGAPKPSKEKFDEFVSWTAGQLDSYAAAHPNPGRTEALHRLNRAEYQNCIRDLLGLEI